LSAESSECQLALHVNVQNETTDGTLIRAFMLCPVAEAHNLASKLIIHRLLNAV